MSDQNRSSAPRIAISFGTSKSSNSARDQSKLKPPPSRLGKRARPHALGHDSNSDDDSDDGHHGRHETITEFGGEEAPKKRPRELVIESQPNRNWKDDLRAKRGGKNLLPPEVQAQQQTQGATKETEPADGDKEIQWGLSVKKRTTESPSAPRPDEHDEKDKDQSSRSPDRTEDGGKARRADRENGNEDAQQDAADAPPTVEDEAMDALLGRKKKTEAERVIRPATEDEAYREDVQRHVGADSTLEDYEAIPDGEFGAALLRGMGWDGKMRGPRPRAAGERRQNLLGLGAKRLKEDEDLGQWNHGAGAGRGRGGGDSKRPPRLHEYRREEERRKAERRERRERGERREGYREEREREGDRYRDYDRERDRGRDRERDGDRGSRNGDSRRY
ncbi:hypothetical protein ACRALDRAFT_1065346 [Sodiomyces alcalophilus JCM 7366]|uniref:uncharacterized protein n=1 Tax=Sodiomyces alcalophilus JCM 7366 TaxID=591952 RepID=UPI0039B5DE52